MKHTINLMFCCLGIMSLFSDTISERRELLERTMNDLSQIRRDLDDYTQTKLNICKDDLRRERSERHQDDAECKTLISEIKIVEQNLQKMIERLEVERDETREALVRCAEKEADFHQTIVQLEEKLSAEQLLYKNLSDEKMKLEVERIELFTIIEELQKRFEGKQVSEEGLKKQLNRLK